MERNIDMVDSNETVMYENGYDSGYSDGFREALESVIDKKARFTDTTSISISSITACEDK